MVRWLPFALKIYCYKNKFYVLLLIKLKLMHVHFFKSGNNKKDKKENKNLRIIPLIQIKSQLLFWWILDPFTLKLMKFKFA